MVLYRQKGYLSYNRNPIPKKIFSIAQKTNSTQAPTSSKCQKIYHFLQEVSLEENTQEKKIIIKEISEKCYACQKLFLKKIKKF